MRMTLLRRAWVIILLAGSLLGVAAPARATSSQIGGTALLNPDAGAPCPGPPSGYSTYVSFAPLVMSGSLTGCWYTLIDAATTTRGGVYLERGRELFVGRLGDSAPGMFTTTYRFEAKLAADGSEVRGRCQHPLVAGSGTGGFAGATGRVDFKDIIGTPITYVYRGHIALR